MPRLPSIIRASALPVLSAATVLAACGGAGDRSVDTEPTASPDTSIDSAATSPKPPVEPMGDRRPPTRSSPDELHDGTMVGTRVTTRRPATTAGVAPCTADAILPATRQALEADGGIQITGVIVRNCQNGYARVTAVPDNSTCGEAGGGCFENEQVFLTATGAGWTYLTSGTGISCATDDDLFPALLAACAGLGLR